MYQMSQYNRGAGPSPMSGYAVVESSGCSGYSRLEHITSQEAVCGEGNLAYSISAPVIANSQASYGFSISLPGTFAFAYGSSLSSLPSSASSASSVKSYASERSTHYASQHSKGTVGQYLSSPSHTEYHFQPDHFLKPGKGGKFVGQAEEVREFVEEAFTTMFDAPFPQDIKISLCTEEQFRKLAPHPGTIGLSINRRKQGLLSEIFVLQGSLGRVLLTVGHELGHVFTGTLEQAQSEEAKAYAFSLAWMEIIKEHNIAGLENAFVEEFPAHNGLHDVAFGFVSKLLRQGQKAWSVWEGLVKGELMVAG